MKALFTLFLSLWVSTLFSQACDPDLTLTGVSVSPNPICSGGTLSVQLTGLPAGQTFTITYKINSGADQTQAGLTSTTNSFTIPNFSTNNAVINVTKLTRTAGGDNCETLFDPAVTSSSITVITTPSHPTVITGPASVCQGQTGAQFSTTSTGATSYTWNLPANWTLTNGANTSTITVSIGASAATGSQSLSVVGNSGSCSSIARATSFTVGTTPAQPAVITGPASVCQGQTGVQFSTTSTGATSYTWNLPANWTLTNGANTSTITVSIGASAATGSQSLSVVGNSGSCSSIARVTSFTVGTTPSQPTVITGPSVICQGQTGLQFSTTSTGATSFNWTVPSNWTITSGGTTNTITVNIGATAATGSQSLSVVGNSGSCSSIARTTSFTVGTTPSQPAVIAGPSNICQGQPGLQFSTTSTGATSYTWTLPANWTITNGANTSTITVNIGANATSGSQDISVSGVNACGNSLPRTTSFSVGTTPSQPAVITGPSSICQGQTGVQFSTTSIGATSFSWAVPSNWTIINGNTTNTITVNIGSTAATGSQSLSVVGVSGACSSLSRSTSISISPLPSTPIAINGITSVCQGANNVTYSTSSTDATSYSWTMPTGFSIVGSNNGSSITVNISSNAPLGPQNISVRGSNSCGQSVNTSSIAVNVGATPLLPPPGNVSILDFSVCAGLTPSFVVQGLPSNTQLKFNYTIGVNSASTNATSNGSGSATVVSSVSAPNSGNSGTIVLNSIELVSAPGCPLPINLAKTFTINPLPAISSITPVTKCFSSTSQAIPITIIAPNASSALLTWLGNIPAGTNNGASFPISNNTITLNTNANVGSYILSPKITLISSSQCTTEVNNPLGNNPVLSINPNPTISQITANNNLRVCSGAPIQQAQFEIRVNNTPYSGTLTSSWTLDQNVGFGATGSSSQPNANGIVNIPSTSGQNSISNNSASDISGSLISFTVTVNNCVSAPHTGTVFSVKPKPQIITLSGFQATLNICSGNDTPPQQCFSTNPALAPTYSFTAGNQSIFQNFPSNTSMPTGCFPQLTVINSTANNLSSSIAVIANRDGCISEPVNFIINARPKPSFIGVTQSPGLQSQILCHNQGIANTSINTNLSQSTTENGLIYSWNYSSAGGGNLPVGVSMTPSIGGNQNFILNQATNTTDKDQPVNLVITVANPNGGAACSTSTSLATFTLRPQPRIDLPISLSPNPTPATTPPTIEICANNAFSFQFEGVPEDAKVNWNQTSPPQSIGVSTGLTTGIVDFEQLVSGSGVNTTTTTITGNFTATPFIPECPAGLQNGTPRAFNISVRPGPLFTATTELNTSQVLLREDTVYQICSGEGLNQVILNNISDIPTDTWFWKFLPTSGIKYNGLDSLFQNKAPTTPVIVVNTDPTQGLVFRLLVRATAGSGSSLCPIEKEFQFLVNPKPIVFPSDTIFRFCDGQQSQVLLSSSVNAPGNIFIWQADDNWSNIGLTSQEGTNNPISFFAKNPSGTNDSLFSTFTVRTTTDKKCESAPKTFVVRVFETPSQPILAIENQNQICSGADYVPIRVTNHINGLSYNWDFPEPNLVASFGSKNGPNNAFNVESGGVIQVFAKNNRGCNSTAGTVTITPSSTLPELDLGLAITTDKTGLIALSTKAVDQYFWGRENCEDFATEPLTSCNNLQLCFPPSSLDLSNFGYWVEVVVDGCRQKQYYFGEDFGENCIKGQVLAIEKPGFLDDKQTYLLYPNPVNENLVYLKWSGKKPSTIKLFSSLGKQIQVAMDTNSEKCSLSLSTLPPGVYYVTIQEKNMQKVLPLIKVN